MSQVTALKLSTGQNGESMLQHLYFNADVFQKTFEILTDVITDMVSRGNFNLLPKCCTITAPWT
jgi:hypothetical protein